MTHRESSGFTLLELMVVALLIGILATIALPSYQNYLKKSRARAATADLVALSAAVENVFQRTLQYPAELSEVTTWQGGQTDHFDYGYEVSGGTYTLEASGRGAMSGCNLGLTNDNVRSVSSAAACGISSW